MSRLLQKALPKRLRRLSRAAVTDGTGKRANIKAYAIEGKTGSEEKVVNGKYEKDANITSFVGVLTTLDPRYIVLIVIDEPQNRYHTGEITAAPVTKSIISKIAPILKVTPKM